MLQFKNCVSGHAKALNRLQAVSCCRQVTNLTVFTQSLDNNEAIKWLARVKLIVLVHVQVHAEDGWPVSHAVPPDGHGWFHSPAFTISMACSYNARSWSIRAGSLIPAPRFT